MAKKCDIVSARDFKIQVCEALGLVPMTVQRIIIDIDSEDMNAPLPVYVQMVGSENILSLDWNQGLLRAIWEPKEDTGDTEIACSQCGWKGELNECLPDDGRGRTRGVRCPNCEAVLWSSACAGTTTRAGVIA